MRFYNLDDVFEPACADWPLCGSPWAPLLISLVYILLVKVAIPRLMASRPALLLDVPMKLYNLLQIAACCYMVYTGCLLSWGTDRRLFCEGMPRDSSDGRVYVWIWRCYMLKIVDLADTLFIVLRKKSGQVTFLHLYHHTIMVVVGFLAIRHGPGIHGIQEAVCNCFVHVVMYSYYLVTCTWPQYRGNVWWKKYITQLQMAQFVILLLHSLPTIFLRDCQYPRVMGSILTLQYSLFLALFYNFYQHSYAKRKPV